MGDFGDEIEAFLIGKARNDSKERTTGFKGQAEELQHFLLANNFCAQILWRIFRGEIGIFCGIPCDVIHPLQHSQCAIFPAALDSVQSVAVFGRLDFQSVALADSRHVVRVDDSRLQEIYVPKEFDSAWRERRRRYSRAVENVPAELSL